MLGELTFFFRVEEGAMNERLKLVWLDCVNFSAGWWD